MLTLPLPCDDPVAKDDIDCIVAAAGKQGWDAADEQKQGKPGNEKRLKNSNKEMEKRKNNPTRQKQREITNEEGDR